MRKTVAVLVILVLWLGYYLGYRNGVQEERSAWLATEKTMTGAAASVSGIERIFYSNPHFRLGFAPSFGRPPVNLPDLRNTPIN